MVQPMPNKAKSPTQPDPVVRPNPAEARPAEDQVSGSEGGGATFLPDSAQRRFAEEIESAAKAANIRKNIPGEGRNPGQFH